MSRTNPPPTQQSTTPSTTSVVIPHEKIAMRAYEKWVKRGRPLGTDVQDWVEAEAELKAELTPSARSSTSRGTTSTSSTGSSGWTSPTGQRY
jgi:hypothetical protein